MSKPDRREALGKMVGAITAVGAVAVAPRRTAHAGLPAVETAVERLLADLPSKFMAGGSASRELQKLFAEGAVLDGEIGPGRYLLFTEPDRAIVLLPLRYRGHALDLPITVDFAGQAATDLQIANVRMGPVNPADLLSAPTAPVAVSNVQGSGLQEEYDALARGGGGVLMLAPGQFATNLVLHSRHVHLCGAGRRVTRLVPADPDQPVLRAAYREGSWDYVTIANLDINGADGRGTGFAAGANAYVEGDEFAGRTRFVNVGFAEISIAVDRRYGQLGLTLDQCRFGRADYHLYSMANKAGQGSIMHAGIMTARDCHFSGARKAVVYMHSSRMGTGGVLFDNCIMERNPGFAFYVPAFNNTDAVTDFVVRDCWNELNSTGAEVRIGGRLEKPRYAFFSDIAMVRFEGTPLGSLALRNAVIETFSCPLDLLKSVDKDSRSSLVHHDTRGFGSYVPIGLATTVAAAAQSDPPGRALSFVIPDRTSFVRMADEKVRISLPADVPINFVGSHSVTSRPMPEGRLPGKNIGQRISLSQGMKIFPPPVSVAPRSWIVWLLTYRLLDGSGPDFLISGDPGISFRRQLQSSDWETLGGMAEVASGAKAVSLWMVQDEGVSDVLVGGYNLVSFADRQSAVDFLNSGSFALKR